MPKDMATTESLRVHAAFVRAQAEMARAIKAATNPHLKSKYADLGAVQDACMPALHSHGFAVIQPLGRDEHGPHVRTILIHESGERLEECPVPIILTKQDMQGLGSAITYARRYGLLCMSGVAPEDDDGNTAGRPAARQPAETAQRPQPDATAHLTAINGAQSLAGLRIAWDAATRDLGNPPPVAIIEAKDARKEALSAPDPQAPADPTDPPF